MHRTRLAGWIVCTTLCLTAESPVPPAAQALPPGFKVVGEFLQPNVSIIDGIKPNANFPKPHMDQGIQFRVSWSASPMARQSLELLAKQPEDPPSQVMGATREEPGGKQTYRGGVLVWRRVIIPWIGGGTGPDLVTWRGSWAGAVSGGMLGLTLSNFAGSKEEALGLMEGVLARIAPN
jgi:hypothetical protein